MVVIAGSSDGIDRKGLTYYDEHLKSTLEPTRNNECVVNHVDSGDYAVGATFSKALRAIGERREPGRLVGRRIGNEPESNLMVRIVAAQTSDGSHK